MCAIAFVAVVCAFGCGRGKGHHEKRGRLAPFEEWQHRVDQCPELQAQLGAEIRFDHQDLPATLTRVAELVNLRIALTPRARSEAEAQRSRRPYYSVLVAEMSFAEALETIARTMALAWEVTGDVVKVGHEEEVEGWMRYRVYPIGDLLGRSEDGSSLPKDTASGAGGQCMSWPCLRVAIQHLIEPEVWRLSNSQLQLVRGHLILKAPGHTCEEVQAFVAALRSAAD